MGGRILILEGRRLDRLIVVLEWCKDELAEEIIELAMKDLDETSQYKHLEMGLRDLRSVLVFLRGSML